MAEAHPATALLGPTDPPPFTVVEGRGDSPFVLVSDHAGQRVPAALRGLGLPQAELDRHIGWDIGIAGTTARLSALLDARAILQAYSRLVIDCNRPLESPTLIVAGSDGTAVPANATLTAQARAARVREIFRPYHDAIVEALEQRRLAPRPTLLMTLHSFTPAMAGVARPWHCGILYHRDARLAHALRDALMAEGDLVVGDNQPYAVSDTSDYAIPVHGEARGLPHVELEIRQDLIADAAGQQAWAERLARLFRQLQAGVVTVP